MPFEKINNRETFFQSEIIKEVRFLILRVNHNGIIHKSERGHYTV